MYMHTHTLNWIVVPLYNGLNAIPKAAAIPEKIAHYPCGFRQYMLASHAQ